MRDFNVLSLVKRIGVCFNAKFFSAGIKPAYCGSNRCKASTWIGMKVCVEGSMRSAKINTRVTRLPQKAADRRAGRHRRDISLAPGDTQPRQIVLADSDFLPTARSFLVGQSHSLFQTTLPLGRRP